MAQDSPKKSRMLCKNASHLLPRPFRQQVSNSCSSFLSLKWSYHLPYVTDPDWSPSGCCKSCFCCAQGEIKCIWEYISPDFLLPQMALHLLPGPVGYIPWPVPAPQPINTGNRSFNVCSEYLTVYLDIFSGSKLYLSLEKNHQLSSPDNLWEEAWDEDAQMPE